MIRSLGDVPRPLFLKLFYNLIILLLIPLMTNSHLTFIYNTDITKINTIVYYTIL